MSVSTAAIRANIPLSSRPSTIRQKADVFACFPLYNAPSVHLFDYRISRRNYTGQDKISVFGRAYMGGRTCFRFQEGDIGIARPALFFPMLNVEWDNIGVDPPNSIEQLYAIAASIVETTADLNARIDSGLFPKQTLYRVYAGIV